MAAAQITPFDTVCVRRAEIQNKNIIKPLKLKSQEVCEKINKQVAIFMRVDCEPEVKFYCFQMCVVDKRGSVQCVVLSGQAWKTKVLSVLRGHQSSP